MTKERPILFSAPMVRAILEGRKTVTRREVKLPRARDSFVLVDNGQGWWPYQSDDGESSLCSDGMERPYNSPYGQPGDRLWVREAWGDVNLAGAPGITYRADDDIRDLMAEPSFQDEDGAFNYDDERVKPYAFAVWSEDLISGAEGRWRPSIHMPRWASRILLEVTAVRVERLQDISADQAIAEGVDADICRKFLEASPTRHTVRECEIHGFAGLWESINGEGSWEANPWVWVVEFKRIQEDN